MTTTSPTVITQTGCSFNGTVNPNGASTDGWFEWGADASYGNLTWEQSLGNGTADVALSQPISGLALATTYHYRAVAENAAGTMFGQDEVCTTLPDATPPGAPNELYVSNPGNGSSLILFWSAASDPDSGVVHYVVYRNAVAITTSTTTSFTDTSLTEGATYTYEVSAVNGVSLEGPKSLPSQGTPRTVGIEATQEVIPIAKWQFDSGGGSIVVDSSGMGNDLTVCKYLDAGTPCASPDIGFWTPDTPSGIGYAGDFIKVPIHYTTLMNADFKGVDLGTASFEISAWIKRPSVGQPHMIVGKQDGGQPSLPGWQFRVGIQDKLVFTLRDATMSVLQLGTTLIPAGTWIHVRVVVDRVNKTIQFYVNGQPDGGPGTIPDALGDISNSENLWVGTVYNTTIDPPYTGTQLQIDQVELNLIHSMVGLWPLSEGSGFLAEDLSLLGNDLGLTADTLWCGPGPSGSGFALCPDGTNFAIISDMMQQGLDLGTLSFEITAWIRREPGSSKTDILVNKLDQNSPSGPGFQFRVGAQDRLVVSLGDGTTSFDQVGTMLIPEGVWMQVQAVVDRANRSIQLYVNGQPDGAAGIIPNGFGSLGNGQDFLVGAGFDGGTPALYIPTDFAIAQLQIKRLPAISTNPLNLTTVGLWLFDDLCPGGIATDASDYHNDLTLLAGSTDCSSGALFGPAARAQADQQGLDLGTASLEISAWIQLPIIGANPIASKTDGDQLTQPGWEFRVGATANLVLSLRDGMTEAVYKGSAVLQADQWYHVRVVVDRVNSTVQFYLNGDPDNMLQTLAVTGSLDNPNDFRAGAGNHSGSFTGNTFTIDRLHIRKSN